MSFDRSQKKPHDYRVPAGRQRCEPAFADSDGLMIDGGRVCSSIETGPGAVPVGPLPPPPPPLLRNDGRLLRVGALPVVCLVVGLTLGIAIGRATAPEVLSPAPQQEAPAAPASTTGADAAPGAEHAAADQAASEGGSADPEPLGPTALPGQ